VCELEQVTGVDRRADAFVCLSRGQQPPACIGQCVMPGFQRRVIGGQQDREPAEGRAELDEFEQLYPQRLFRVPA
jgi:hypothetical protein